MKKFYLIVLALSVALPSVASSHRQAFVNRMAKESALRKAAARAAADEHKWRVKSETIYVWEDEWIEDADVEYTYDADGNILTNLSNYTDGSAVLETFVYNEYGKVISTLKQNGNASGEFVNSEKKEVEYDPVAHNLITSNKTYQWRNDSWDFNGNIYRRTVKRDGNGNITSIELFLYYNNNYDPIERLTITYGADGKAAAIKNEQLVSDGFSLYWETSVEMTDIVWDRTDGQITGVNDLFSGSNRISSAKINDEGTEKTVTATYYPGSESFTTVTKYMFEDAQVVATRNVNVLDAWGSYDLDDTEVYTYDGNREAYTYLEKLHYNDFGLETLVYAAFRDEGMEPDVAQWTVGTTVDDPEYGYPVEYVLQDYDPDAEEFINAIRSVFHEYVDMAGVGDVIAGDGAAAPEYFTLSGVRVVNPSVPGLYIERRSSSARKVLIK